MITVMDTVGVYGGREAVMSFQGSAESWKAKLHVGDLRAPVLVGITVIAVLVLVFAGKALFDGISSDGFRVERVDQVGDATGSGREDSDEEAADDRPAPLLVHVGGAVVKPGVYEVSRGARVYDAVEAAGGFTDDAASDACNLARVVDDGEQIIIASHADIEATSVSESPLTAKEGSGTSGTTENGKININRASAVELDTLPGVGMSTADKIIADREANGPFKTIDDLKRVSGIGDKKYEALADLICVG